MHSSQISAALSEASLLKKIINNIKVQPIRVGDWTEEDFRSLGMMSAKIGPAGIIGIRVEASEAVNGMAEKIFTDTVYQRGLTFSALDRKSVV